jgi:hypothetical protein
MTIEPFVATQYHPVESWTHLYRVGFWWQQHPDLPPEESSWGVEVWDLSAEDVHEVIAWADEKAGLEQRIYTLYVRVEDGHRPGEDLLVQIAGADPTRNPPGYDDFYRQHPLR